MRAWWNLLYTRVLNTLGPVVFAGWSPAARTNPLKHLTDDVKPCKFGKPGRYRTGEPINQRKETQWTF